MSDLNEKGKQARNEYNKAYVKEWKAKNPTKSAQYQKKWRESHKEEYNAYMKEYIKEWRKKNKDKLKQYNANYWNKKGAEDEQKEA